MSEPAKRRATYADVLAVPPHRVAEIVNGELVVSPRPAPRHARVSSALGVELGGPFDKGKGGPGGWWILDEPEIHFSPGEPLVPDLAGWRRERMPTLPETAYFEAVPDWVCEVLSPTTAAVDRIEKMPIYAARGVLHAWLIDPLLETLEVFRMQAAPRGTPALASLADSEGQGQGWFLAGTYRGAAVVRAEPFDAIEIELALLWRH